MQSGIELWNLWGLDMLCRGPTTSHRGSVGEQHVGVGDGTMDPDALAHTYWHLHTQDRNAWTQEIDLRSSTSRFF